jgi:hypothetical protein
LPRLDQRGLQLSDGYSITGELQSAWDYCVGGHPVCSKWLRARRGRELSLDELNQFLRIIEALQQTIRISQDIDRAIADCGGWPTAFVGRV